MKRRIIPLVILWVLFGSFCMALAAEPFILDPDEIETKAQSVLMLEIYDSSNERIATGSGFVMFDNMTLVTNYHVIEDADMILADSDDGYQYIVSKALIVSEEKDIAILQFMTPTVMAPLAYNEGTIKRGESVVAIGSPIGLKNTVSMGNVSAIFTQDDLEQIQFTAAISSGSSGGALFNGKGEVIGITSASYIDGQNLNIAIKITEAVELYKKWDGQAHNISEYNKKDGGVFTPVPTTEPTAKPTAEPITQPAAIPDLADDAVIATVNGKDIVWSQLKPDYNSLVNNYGSNYDMTDPLNVNLFRAVAMENQITEYLMQNYAEQNGLDKLTDEEIATANAQAYADWQSVLEHYISYYHPDLINTSSEKAIAAARAEAVAYFVSAGYTPESLRESYRQYAIFDKVEAMVTQDVVVTDEEAEGMTESQRIELLQSRKNELYTAVIEQWRSEATLKFTGVIPTIAEAEARQAE